jgi:hypothetical protein
MTDSEPAPATGEQPEQIGSAAEQEPMTTRGRNKKSLSMHEGIAVWCDCCSCEAEPYWVEVAEELGIDLGGDYEDEDEGDRSAPRD